MKGAELPGKLHPNPSLHHPMRPLLHAFIWCTCLTIAILIVGCTAPRDSGKAPPSASLLPGDSTAPSQVTPSEALAIAKQYSDHPWTPFARNILHAKDPDGVLVDTPDVGLQDPPERPGWWIPGEVNRGMPYKWGGFDSLASFSSGVATGLAAGDVSSPAKRRAAKRRADNAAVSQHAAGVDCSGFVSRCLKLPTVYDTTQLPSICAVLASADELRPGDLLNIPRGHVLLCAGWARPDRSWIYFYDTGSPPDYWRPSLKEAPLGELLELGYAPLRYRGMAREPEVSGKEVLTRAVRAKALTVPNPVVGEP